MIEATMIGATARDLIWSMHEHGREEGAC